MKLITVIVNVIKIVIGLILIYFPIKISLNIGDVFSYSKVLERRPKGIGFTEMLDVAYLDGYNGVASNFPIMLGLMAIGGCILLSSVKFNLYSKIQG